MYSAMYECTLKTLKEGNPKEREEIRIIGSKQTNTIQQHRRMFEQHTLFGIICTKKLKLEYVVKV